MSRSAAAAEDDSAMGFAEDVGSAASSVSSPGDDLLMRNEGGAEDERMLTEGEDVRLTGSLSFSESVGLTLWLARSVDGRSRTLLLSPPSLCSRQLRLRPDFAYQARYSLKQRCRTVVPQRPALVEAREGCADVRFGRRRV